MRIGCAPVTLQSPIMSRNGANTRTGRRKFATLGRKNKVSSWARDAFVISTARAKRETEAVGVIVRRQRKFSRQSPPAVVARVSWDVGLCGLLEKIGLSPAYWRGWSADNRPSSSSRHAVAQACRESRDVRASVLTDGSRLS